MIGAKRNQGIALVMALLMAVVVGIIVLGSLQLSIINRQISANDSLSNQALNVAQAGNAYWKAEIVGLYQYMLNNFDKYQDDFDAYMASGPDPEHQLTCGNYLIMGLDLNRDGTIEYTPGYNEISLPSITVPVGSQNGTAEVVFQVQGSTVVLTSKGSFAGARATVKEGFTVSQLDIWNNAVFAESSAGNSTISGRAEIRGAVHILGDTLSSSSVALDLSGTSGLGNTYRGLNPSLGVSSEDLRLSSPDPIDLCATLRVKHGKVALGGNAQLGYNEAANAAPVVDSLLGIYTNDGITGGSENSNVFSKNGMTAKYDAGDSYTFPELDDFRPGETTTWAQELRNNGLVLSGYLPASRDDRNVLPHTGLSLTLAVLLGYPQSKQADGRYVYLDASCRATPLFDMALNGTGTAFNLDYDSDPFSCRKYRTKPGQLPDVSPPNTDEIVTEVIWTGDTGGSVITSGGVKPLEKNELYIGGTNGAVVFWGGDLDIFGGTGNREITYRGDGVLFAEDRGCTKSNTPSSPCSLSGVGGDITSIDGAFLPTDKTALRPNLDTSDSVRDGLAQTTTVMNTYPATSVLGLIARSDVGTDAAQSRFTGAIYAAKQVNVTKQMLVAGSIVTKVFDAGSQVPTILYVPNIGQRLSRLMPGAGGSGLAVSNTSWIRE